MQPSEAFRVELSPESRTAVARLLTHSALSGESADVAALETVLRRCVAAAQPRAVACEAVRVKDVLLVRPGSAARRHSARKPTLWP